MSEQEIINRIDILNLKLENANSTLIGISKNLNDVNILFHEFIPKFLPITSDGLLDKYGQIIMPLVGVILGALITYFFNKKMSKDEVVGRFAIQRKNLIYAPLYKELLQLNKYIELHKNTCYINIIFKDYDRWDENYYYDEKRHESGFFTIWNEMKNDIRKDYIPKAIQGSLEEINSKWKIYIKNRDKIDKDFKTVYQKYKIDDLHKEADKKKNGGGEGSIINLATPAFLYKKNDDYLSTFDKVCKNYGLSNEVYNECKNELEKLFKNLTTEVDRTNLFTSHDEVIKSIIKADKEINKLIKFIISNYEFGDELEKYV